MPMRPLALIALCSLIALAVFISLPAEQAAAATGRLAVTTLAVADETAAAAGSASVGIPQPLAGVTVPGLIGMIIQRTLGFVGVIALVMFIYGGLTWMLASGNEEKIGSAKKTVIWAALGLVMVFASYLITNLVITTLAQDTMAETAKPASGAPAK